MFIYSEKATKSCEISTVDLSNELYNFLQKNVGNLLNEASREFKILRFLALRNLEKSWSQDLLLMYTVTLFSMSNLKLKTKLESTWNFTYCFVPVLSALKIMNMYLLY